MSQIRDALDRLTVRHPNLSPDTIKGALRACEILADRAPTAEVRAYIRRERDELLDDLMGKLS